MPSTLYFNGTILTMDAQNSSPEAVLTKDDRIQAVGTETDLRARMPADAQEYDLEGRTLVPAFIDPHGHFPDPGFIRLFRVDLSPPPLGDCREMAQALDRLRKKANATPEGEWVMGVSFDNTSILEGRMPTRAELDTVSQLHPIWVLHASGHNGAANSLALERCCVNRQTPDPDGGRFGRDPETGALTGVIEGLSAMGEMGDTDFLIDRDRFWQGFDACRDEYLSHGVTYAQNAWSSQTMLDHFASLPADQDPGIDIELLPVGSLEPELSKHWIGTTWPGNPHFTLGPRKLFTDGAFQLQTAFLSAPYFRPTDPDHPCGMAYTSQQQLDADVAKLHGEGLQIHCHCNGDAGAEMFIDAMDKALQVQPRQDHRHTIIHGQALRDDQLERMARLGLTVSFFPAHVYFWGDRHYDTFLGPERSQRISPAASAERYGVRYTIHNDASVTPTRPIHLAHCAVNRTTASGRVLGEDQKISVLSALRAQTIDAAWQVFKEDHRGSIEPGKVADFAVLSRNPLHHPDRLKETRVLETVRNGQSVFATPHTVQEIEPTQ
ncbi:amidohydrolase [Ruegeria atlantica]|uniref:amidohydrolase n=1 Tax=Ruegeria atlantica TaxID=81569 RepID=UPI00147CC28B|nr:amidohydrolase [Ruegeria atlantica]